MGARTILLLLVIVGGLWLTLWFTSQKPPISTTATASALDGRSLVQSKRVRWAFPDIPPVGVERGDDGVFRMTEPIVDRAASGFMQQIVQVWDSANLLATEYADDADGQRETGLAEPTLRFLVEWPDGHRIEYDVGGPGPLGTDRFLRRDGKIWRGGEGLYESMRVNLDDLRDRQVFLNREFLCREVRLESTGETGKREVLRLERKDGQWRMREPFDGRVQPAAAVSFVTAVLALRADVFLSGMVRLPERAADATVEVSGSFGTEKVELWVERGAAFGQLPGRASWFQCDPGTHDAVFTNAVDRLRARALLGHDDIASELAAIVIDPGEGRGDRIDLVRSSVGSDWQLALPVDHPAHATPTNELVQAINNLRAVEFVDDKVYDDPAVGLAAGRTLLSVRFFEQQEATDIWLGAKVERGGLELAYACRADEIGTVVLVPYEAALRIRREWTVYCDRQVLRIPVQVGELAVARPDGAGGRTFKRGAEHWLEAGKPERSPEVDEIGEFIQDELRDLEGKSVIDLRLDRLGAPHWIIKLGRGNGDVLQTVKAWDRGPELPIVLQPERFTDVGFEVGVRASKVLRKVWQ